MKQINKVFFGRWEAGFKANKKYCPQTLLEECKYVQEKMKIENYINQDLENSESDSDSNNETESDEDFNNDDK